jgi:hypothetical protein
MQVIKLVKVKENNMKSLEEAEEYSDYKNDYAPMSFGDKFNPTTKKDFIAGANSKWVQAEKIKAQIDILKLAHLRLSVESINKTDNIIVFTINELEQQLKELEDESKTD